MKKFILMFMMLIASTVAINAQHVEETKLFDNVSMTIKGGVTSPLSTPIEHIRPVVGIELEKMITPVFGGGLEGEWTVNTSKWIGIPANQWFDHQYVGVYGVTNLMNLFGGYDGKFRLFEMETVLGVGWGHAYTDLDDANYVMTKAGLNLNFNINEAWAIAIKPAVVWNLNDELNYSKYNINKAALQLQAGITYHFNGPSKSRNFILCNKVATQDEINNLNDQINKLREQNIKQLEECNDQVNALLETNKILTNALKECESRKAPVVINHTFVPIQFKKGSSTIINSNASIKAMAEVMKQTGHYYTITGYASEEGDEDFNKELSLDRAASVADELIFWGVNPENIGIKGMGATNQFGESPELNRVVEITR